MTEQKHISPLLDGFTMGNPMSEHNGIRCCPAIKENSEKKYIVKIIAIPSTQVQMDALLLAGAYKDASGAMDYFKTVVGDVFKEAELLKELSKLEGFLGYEGWQMEPITRRRLGYEVYLLGSYRRSLDKFVRKNPITQLEAMNLGLDMCAALSVCRHAGALYVDLKPTNIFVSDKKEYRIGDLGFVSLDALSYTALPDKYRSPYTPPELLDPMATVNLTADTYALGMILYQIYNDGQLPVREEDGTVPSPAHADYELAEIILKAIAASPEDRWPDPKEMGQAIVAYMQRNAVNDVPITPYVPLEQPEEEKPEAPAEEGETNAEAPAGEETAEEPADETVPGEEDADALLPHEMSEELSKMVAKADDLIAHETPEGVVVPEIPEAPDPFAFAKEDEVDDSDVPHAPLMEDPAEETQQKKHKSFASQEGKKKAKKFLTGVASLALVAGLTWGSYWAYQNLYIQTVESLSITGSRSQLDVSIRSGAAEDKLTVTCTDQYGNVLTQAVENGRASFSGLKPNTMYTVSLNMDGFHKLVGQTSEVFTTDTTTSIVTFSSVAGPEDGSLILNFTVDGTEPDRWVMVYSAPGEEEQRQLFSGHSLTVKGLKLGKVYTFTLEAEGGASVSGKTSLDVMASRLILAQDITVASAGGSDIVVRWRTPGDIVVDSWKVRCYSEAGYEQELTVQGTEAHFTGLDFGTGYTVEITAAGMTQSARSGITADPLNITGFHVDESDPEKLDIRWDYQGDAPEGGWLLLYSVDGSERPDVIKTDSPAVTLSSRIPEAKYRFTIHASDGTSVFSNVHDFTTGPAPSHEANELTPADLTVKLLKTPEQENWRTEKVSSDAFTNEFAVGDRISMTLESSKIFYRPGNEVDILYVIRDSHGTVFADWCAHERIGWNDLWVAGNTLNAELNLPHTPEFPGSFTVSVLINGRELARADFTVK